MRGNPLHWSVTTGAICRVGIFGGGTPSVLTSVHYERIFAALHDAFALLPNAEISLEVNPADVTRVFSGTAPRLVLTESASACGAIESELPLV
ncbi:MAG: hypothetical protein U0670_12370 [Anaerolineae bacterium]